MKNKLEPKIFVIVRSHMMGFNISPKNKTFGFPRKVIGHEVKFFQS